MTTLLAAARIAAASSGVALRTTRSSFAPAADGLHLAEGSEQHVGERAIHGLAHDHGENEAGRSIERAGHDQHFAIQNKSQQGGGKAGVGVQQRDDRRHVSAADGSDQQHAKNQRHDDHDREQQRVRGIDHQRNRQAERCCENGEADEVLSAIDDRALRQNFLQLSRGDQAAGKGERADDDFERDLAHLKARDRSGAHVIFGNADQGRRKRAESVAHGGSLRHGRHVYQAQRDADSGADDQADDDPLVLDQFRVEERGDDGQRSADLSRQNAPARAGRRTQQLERKNEENDRDNVGEIEILLKRERGHDFFDLDLNMRSMRSVIRNPPTMLLNDAATAIAPSTVVSRVSCRPAMMMAPPRRSRQARWSATSEACGAAAKHG